MTIKSAGVNPESIIIKKNNKTLDYLKIGSLIIFLILTIILRLNIAKDPIIGNIINSITFSPLVIFAWIHGSQRYGIKNMAIWFVITWIVSNGFEALSIYIGFPFGNYYYNFMTELNILGVPAPIMIIYFGISYTSWTVAQIVLGLFNKKITGIYKFILPFTTAIIMTMWDLVTDPQASTIKSNWIWENGGNYFGVPISNFIGWVFVVYVFMQIFTLFISKKEIDISINFLTSKKSYWIEAAVMYLIMGLGVVIEGFFHIDNAIIYTSMAMISVFTMVFTAGISFNNIINLKDL
jgi:uncharacterized membrane protein